MFVYIAVFVGLAVIQTSAVGTFCQLGDCSLTNSSNCSWIDLAEDEFYVPLEPPNPAAADPEHLFNLIFDPSEKSCRFLRVGRLFLEFGKFAFLFEVLCASNVHSSFVILFDVYTQQNYNSTVISCIRRDAVRINQAKKCGFFAHEKLRLTFSENADQLLMEDLTGEGPNRTSLLLQKTKYYKNMLCTCNGLQTYWWQKYGCIQDAEREILNVNLALNSNETSDAKWVELKWNKMGWFNDKVNKLNVWMCKIDFY